ncbi:MAG TPA: cytochrome c3 family protein [Tepidisphaeraceae bacterium]|nr:cytochrome c3 family protein [Tepidisphaeraceae bacterium]
MILLISAGCDRDSERPAEPTTGPVGSSMEHFDSATTKQVMAFAPTKAAPKPTGALAKDTSCMTAECHANFSRAAQIHSPVAQHACDSCHDADIGGHKYPLKRNAIQTCTFCHSVSGTQGHQHKVLEQGCLVCHDAHTSQTKFLLKADSVEQLCSKCHEIPLKKFAHEPFVKGECTLCHQPHQSENKALLRGGEGAKECFTCHDGLRVVMSQASFVHKPAAKDCNTCHDPHSTDNPKQLRAPLEQNCYTCHDQVKKHVEGSNVQHAAMMSADKCANCHNAHASDQRDLLKHRMDQVCLTCHDKPIPTKDSHTILSMKSVLGDSKFLHGPIRAGSCSGCHDPHGSKYPDLLEKSFPKTFYTSFELGKYELCFSCHESRMVLEEKTTSLTNFRDGDRNLHFMHVNRDDKGRSCKTCHAIHGSDLPNHMASSVPFEGSNWSMPIEFAKTSNGGSCAPGCHVPKTYSRLTPTTAPATRGVK